MTNTCFPPMNNRDERNMEADDEEKGGTHAARKGRHEALASLDTSCIVMPALPHNARPSIVSTHVTDLGNCSKSIT